MQFRQATHNVVSLFQHGPATDGRSGTDARAITIEGQMWRGASGRHYTHTVHSLILCPAPLRASYVLARRERDGRCVALSVGATPSDVASLNLAHIRREASRLGANEVHLQAGQSLRDRAVTVFDIGSEQGLSHAAEMSTALQ